MIAPNNCIAKYIATLVVLIVSAQSLSAQEAYDYLATEHSISNNISLNSDLFSSSIFDTKVKFSSVEIDYDNTQGDFHRVQQGDRNSKIGFFSDGSYIGDRFYMVGSFKFSQNYNNGVRFTTLLDPFRGTPYDLADSTYSNWRSQNYTAMGKVAYELLPDLLSFGVEATTSVARGAKQVDPRPKTNNSDIEFTPSLSLSLGDHLLSIGGSYNLFKESVDLILYNSSESQKIYEMKGLGQYTYSIFSNSQMERNYNGSGAGASASYRYRKGGLTLYLEGGYNNYTEEALDIDQSKLNLRGRLYSNKGSLDFKGDYATTKSLNTLKLHYTNNNRSGREIIQVFNPSEEVNSWVTESEIPQRWQYSAKDLGAEYIYSMLSDDQKYTPISIAASSNYSSITEGYRVMDTYRGYDTLYAQIAPQYSVNWSEKIFSTLKLTYGYNKVDNFRANYTGRELECQVIDDMYFNHDAAILRQDYSKIGISLNLGLNIKRVGAILLAVDYQHLKSINNQVRDYLTSSISYNF